MPSTLEGWKSFFEIGGLVFVFLTFASAVGALISGNRVNAVQKRELREFQLRIESEQQKTAQAQKEAAEAQQTLNQFLLAHAFPRQLKSDIRESLRSLPPAKAEVCYKELDFESLMFANAIQNALTGSGWNVSAEVIPIPANRFNGKDLIMAGVQIVDNRDAAMFPVGPPPARNLTDLRQLADGMTGGDVRPLLLAIGTNADVISKDATLPDNFFRVVVGPRSPLK
jgi:hypothetical protein